MYRPLMSPQPSSPPTVRRDLALLVVDDSASVRTALCTLLVQLGLCDRVLAVKNGFDALDALARDRYDVVLMDLQMPGLDGLETTRRLKRTRTRSTMPRIIAISADDSKETRDLCRAAGMDDFLTKPILAEQLEEVMRRPRPGDRCVDHKCACRAR